MLNVNASAIVEVDAGQLVAHVQCPACAGKGCHHCRQGWMPKPAAIRYHWGKKNGRV